MKSTPYNSHKRTIVAKVNALREWWLKRKQSKPQSTRGEKLMDFDNQSSSRVPIDDA